MGIDSLSSPTISPFFKAFNLCSASSKEDAEISIDHL
jgi:hypothetical protein